MPPKKDAKKEAVARPDNSGIPKNDIDFKFEFAAKMAPEAPAFAVMFEWFATTSEKTERYDTGFIEAWTKSTTAPEEVVFERVFDPIRVDDDFCKRLSSGQFYLYVVDEEMKVKFETTLDLSSLLMGTSGPQSVLQKLVQVAYFNDKLPIIEIEHLRLTVSSNKELLTEVYRKYLNPFQVEVIGARNVPDSTAKNYLPVYTKYTFFDGTEVSTQPVYGYGKVKWEHKHVFLAGLIEPTLLKQKLRSNYLRVLRVLFQFQLHDRDELVRNAIKEDVPLMDVGKIIAEELAKEAPVDEDPKKKGGKKEAKKETKEPEKKDTKKDAKKDGKKKDMKLGEPIRDPKKIETVNGNYGIAAFFLVDFLNANNKHFKLQAPVVPRTTFEDFESKNIDLNTTARTEMQKVIASNNYFENDTRLVVGFTLSCPIGSFVKPAEPPPEPVAEDPKKKKEGKDAKKEVPAEERPVSPAAPIKPPERKDVFERVIYLMPYKSPDLVRTVQEIFYDANLKAMKLPAEGLKELKTIVLKPEQKQDKSLDILTGIEILDSNFRLFIIEGLREGAMRAFGQRIEKLQPNTKLNKILKNSNIGFLERLYVDFNLDFKRIRLRPNLTELLLEPSIYIKSKVPQEICANLNNISNIKRIADNLKTVETMNWWPEAKWLVQIERKFSDNVSYEDIFGEAEQKKSKKVKDEKQGSPTSTLSPTRTEATKKDDTSLPRLAQTKPTGDRTLPQVRSNTLNHKSYAKTGFNTSEHYNLHLKYAEIPPGQEVYIYSGQTNNWYEGQMRSMREQMQKDRNKLYTYGQNHLSLSIDPVSLEEKKKQEYKLERTVPEGKPAFSSLIVRTKDQRMRLSKRPNDETINDMKKYPYHEDKAYEAAILKNTRGLPLNNGRDPFCSYVGKIQVFSQPELLENERISPVEKERMEREERARQLEEEKKKMKGDAYIYIKKEYCSDHPAQLDKYQGILEGEPKKKGLLLSKQTIANSKIGMSKAVGELPVSAFIHDRFDASVNPLVRVDRPEMSVAPTEFHNFQNPEFLTKTAVHRPLKKTTFD